MYVISIYKNKSVPGVIIVSSISVAPPCFDSSTT